MKNLKFLFWRLHYFQRVIKVIRHWSMRTVMKRHIIMKQKMKVYTPIYYSIIID